MDNIDNPEPAKPAPPSPHAEYTENGLRILARLIARHLLAKQSRERTRKTADKTENIEPQDSDHEDVP